MTLPLVRRMRLVRDRRLLRDSPLFDCSFYLERSPGGPKAGIDPLRHYLNLGGFEGRDPHPLFDSDWYLQQNPDVANSGANPLIHYLRQGWKEGRAPHALFDPAFYQEGYPDMAKAGIDPLQHYLNLGGFEGRDPHPLFDSDWYLQQNRDLAGSGINPLVHYLRQGWKEGRAPHALFDPAFYQERYPDVAKAGIDPLQHYLNLGGFEGRDPHPLFDSDWYLQQNRDLAGSGINPLVHYLRQGWKEGRAPHALFDPAFYQERYPDVAKAGIDPLQHYLNLGGFEGRDPHPLFDSDWYLQQNRDVADSGINPLVHYLRQGWKEGRAPHALFDPAFYQERYPDVAKAGIDSLQHYLNLGGFEGRDPHPLFDSDWYLQQNPDVANSGINPLIHYLRQGWKEGRAPHALFDPAFYQERYPDMAKAGIDPLQHYLNLGGFEGRDPHPLFDSDWYLQQNRDVANSGINPLIHYLRQGWKEGRAPHALFDPAFYQERYPDMAKAGIDPLQHYLNLGGFEGRDPHPLFDSDWYLQQNPDVANSGINPLIHYLRQGWKEGCNPHPLFDGDWYLRQSASSVAVSGVNPLVHYVREGWKEGTDPHPLFDSAFYKKQNPDMARVNPLLHYLARNAFEGGDPHPLFDGAFYLEQTPDVAAKRINPLVHYVTTGILAGRDPNRFFDTSFYLMQYPDVATSGINPLVHYARSGASEGRLPNRWFGKQYPHTLPTVCGQEEWDEYGRNRLNALLSSTKELIFQFPESPELSIILALHSKAHLSLLCLESLLANADCNYELIIIDNNSTEGAGALLDRCKGARIIRNLEQVGFAEACMTGAVQSHSEYLLFLNDDVLLESGALTSALQNFKDDTVGAIGGKILLANGALKEAGSIVWSDGSVDGYGRLDQPDLPQYEFRRSTDCCSVAFLFTSRKLFNQLGGFDPIYTPACYKDTDYCMKVWEAGLRVIYNPQSVIRHYESASSGGNQLADSRKAANQDKFVTRWQRSLLLHCPPSVENLVRARIASQSRGLRILYLDDLVPHKSLGAGFPRSNDILHHLVKQGHHVTFATMRRPLESLSTEYGDIAREIELIDGTRSSERLFREYVPMVNLIWVSRPHNLASFLEMVMEFGGFSAKLIFDAEAIYSDRDRLQANLRNASVPLRILNTRLKRELALAQAADTVIVVSPRDQAVMEREGVSNIHVLGFCLTPNPTPAPFCDRHSFLFVGAVHGSENPNADSIRYFCSEIWPEVRRRTGAELIIAGFGTDRYLTDIECEGLRIVGPVEDLTSVYNQARVFVAPTRYAAGIPFKVHEAAASGVPSVVSQLIGEQLGWEDGKDVLVGRDEAALSNLCCELYANEALWHELRANVLSRVRAELHPVAYAEKISSILAGTKN